MVKVDMKRINIHLSFRMPYSKSKNRSTCCVPFCDGNGGTSKLFMFPRNRDIGEMWLQNINNPRFRYTSYTIIRQNFRVCGQHFEDDDFYNPERKKLLPNRIPTIFTGETAPDAALTAPVEEEVASAGVLNFRQLPGLQPLMQFPQPSTSTSTAQFTPVAVTLNNKQKLRRARKKTRDAFLSRNSVRHFLLNLSRQGNYQIEIRNFFSNLSVPAVTFILSQLKRGSKFNKTRQWTNAEKAVFLSIYKTSPRCYRFLSKMFCLPSVRTLGRSLKVINLKAGINEVIFQHLSHLSGKMKPMSRYCILMFDEVYLQPHISCSRQYRSVFGLEDFGLGFTKYIADHALVFMLRGINQNWKQPICYYFVKSGTKTPMLKNIIREVIKVVHAQTKFRILATVSDQGSANQAAIGQLSRESGHFDHFIFKIKDFVEGQTVEYTIFHIFDPPHLLKCLRNHFMQKNVYFDDKVAKWSDLEDLYRTDGDNPDSKMCLKLTEKHIRPEGRLKMRVSLASQVFSRTVYAALLFANKFGAHYSAGTIEFILFMDQLFDSLNGVRNSTKPLRRPLTDRSAHNDFWCNAKALLAKLIFKKDDVNVRAPPSVRNFIVTIRSIQSLWVHMKGLGFKCLLTRCLNQDPLENFFGIIRGLCGQSNRPTCSQFVAAFKTCLINNLQSTSSFTNCEDDATDFLLSLLQSSIPKSTETSTSSINVSRLPSYINYPSSPNLSTEIPNFTKVISTVRSHTSAYIAGFIYKKFMKHDCSTCNKYFIATSAQDDCHGFIISREFGKLTYPSSDFISVVNKNKLIIYREFILNINSSDLQEAIGSKLPTSLFNACKLHDIQNNVVVKKCLTVIIINYVCKLINRKITYKDRRPNKLVDEYLRIYGSDIKKI